MKSKDEVEWKFYTTDKTSSMINKVNGFRKLTRGWHYGEGFAPDDNTINNAIDLLKIASSYGLQDSDAFPGIEGDILILLYSNNDILEFSFECSGEIDYIRQKDKTTIDEREHLDIKNAVQVIRNFRKESWKLSDYSPLDTSIPGLEGSRVEGSKTQEKKAGKHPGFRFSSGSALLSEAEAFAST